MFWCLSECLRTCRWDVWSIFGPSPATSRVNWVNFIPEGRWLMELINFFFSLLITSDTRLDQCCHPNSWSIEGCDYWSQAAGPGSWSREEINQLRARLCGSKVWHHVSVMRTSSSGVMNGLMSYSVALLWKVYGPSSTIHVFTFTATEGGVHAFTYSCVHAFIYSCLHVLTPSCIHAFMF